MYAYTKYALVSAGNKSPKSAPTYDGERFSRARRDEQKKRNSRTVALTDVFRRFSTDEPRFFFLQFLVVDFVFCLSRANVDGKKNSFTDRSSGYFDLIGYSGYQLIKYAAFGVRKSRSS